MKMNKKSVQNVNQYKQREIEKEAEDKGFFVKYVDMCGNFENEKRV